MDGRVHRISVSLVFGISVSLQPSVELEVAPCSVFLGDVVELSQRVLNFDEPGLWTGQSALRIEVQIIFNTDRTAFECMARSHFPHKI